MGFDGATASTGVGFAGSVVVVGSTPPLSVTMAVEGASSAMFGVGEMGAEASKNTPKGGTKHK